MSAAMQYSKPPLMLSGSSPFQKPGAGRDVTTVSSPSLVSSTSPSSPFADCDVAVAEVHRGPTGVAAAATAVVAARGDCEHQANGQAPAPNLRTCELLG